MPSQESKQNFAAMRSKILAENSGKEYWRSVEEFSQTPEFEDFVKGEFPLQAEEWDDGLSRRKFMKVMGASLAFAGLSGCVIQPAEKIIPYVRPNEDMIPGKPMFYATAMTMGGTATGLLAESYEGRPVKLEGNPSHPGSLGATDVYAQAALLDMYDPDRSQQMMFRGSPSSWQTFVSEARNSIVENQVDGGAGVRFLTPSTTSPTLQAQFRQIASEMPNARWIQFDAVSPDNQLEGARLAFGSPAHTVYRFDRATRVLSLDADIFSGSNVRYMADFATARRITEEKRDMNRLYAVESTLTLMGAKADHRLAVKPSQVFEVSKAIAAAFGVSGAQSTYSENAEWIAILAKDLSENRGSSLVVAGENQPPAVHALAHAMNAALGAVGQTVIYTEPLVANTERSQMDQFRELIADIDAGRVKMLIMLGGNPVYSSPADLKLNFDRVNEKVPLRIHLGTHYDETAEICHWHIPEKHFLEMWSDARAFDGTVTTIQPLIDPLYASARSVHEIVQLFMRENFDRRDYDIVREYWQTQNINAYAAETSMQTAFVPTSAAPSASPSPTASPTPSASASPAASPGTNVTATATPANGIAPTASPAATPGTAAGTIGGARTFEDHWRKMIHDGFLPNSASATKSVSANTAFLSQPASPPAAAGDLEISILPDPSIYDGRFANNGWMQELPNPFTKITWENVALVSPATAQRLGVNQSNDPREISGGERPVAFINAHGSNMFADVVNLTYSGLQLEHVPMWIAPGQPDDTVTIFMGYGRTNGGRIAKAEDGSVRGYDAFKVRQSNAMNYGLGGIQKTGETAEIATTQIHFNLEPVDGRSRDILRVWDIHHLEEHLVEGKQPDFYSATMYQDAAEFYTQEWYAKNHKWAMSIDLNSCVGCNACVLACQSENNIPVVGKEQVAKSREMHWLRVDTYYQGDDINSPEGAHFQPLPCMQCEQAPCEVVCPVTATVHNPEGLNDMVYNRCVGTRYCSNNCPYKVRRFNFLLYQDWDTPQYKLMRNPEVTVRSRGVMEKCTYCTQRISAARIEAEKDGRRVRDGEVLTACQSVCPTGAIVFGDMNDPLSKVAAIKKDRRNYNLLNELNTQPRTTYLAEMKNRNTEMPDYKAPVFTPKPEGKQKPGNGAH